MNGGPVILAYGPADGSDDEQDVCRFCGFGPLPENWQFVHPVSPTERHTGDPGTQRDGCALGTYLLCGFCARSVGAVQVWMWGGDYDLAEQDATMRANILRAEILAAR